MDESYESLDQWAKANPEIAGPAINSLAYADFMGQGPRMISPPDGINHERAEQRFKDYIKLTDSPNADDSYAEYLASQGDYSAALANQSNAFQKLYFVSPYLMGSQGTYSVMGPGVRTAWQCERVENMF